MEKYIQPFIDVCKNVFKSFIDVELREGRPFCTETKKIFEWDISAVIGLSGEAQGAVVISMRNELAIRLVDIITGSKHTSVGTEVDKEVIDAIGEISNIIAGNAKKGLENDFHVNISLPTIVKGNNHLVGWPHFQTRCICIPFSIFDDDSFTLSIAINSAKG